MLHHHWENAVHKRMFTLALIWLLGTILLLPTDASAQGELTMEARAGFDGYYKMGGWLPVTVVAANEGPPVEGHLQIEATDSGGRQVVYTQPAVLPTRSRKQFTLYTFVDTYTRELTVKLMQKDKLIAERKVAIEPLNAEDFLYVVVSDNTAALNYLTGLPPVGKGRAHVAHLPLADLPAQGRALSSVDAIVLHNTDTAPLTDVQRAALRGWIAFGGHLIVTGGPNAVPIAAGLGDLLPVQVNGTQTVADWGGLGDFAEAALGTDQPIVIAQAMPIGLEGPWPARVLASTNDLPLIVSRPMDRGKVDYLAFDPDLDSIRSWSGHPKLWLRLLFSTPLTLRPGGAQIGWGSFSQPLANIPSLNVPSVLLIVAFLFFYIVIVGPLNLLVLKLFDKQALAWITIPTMIILFSCVAYLFGFASRGHKVVVSEVTVVRAQPQSQMAAVDTFVGLYSPSRRRYDVQLPDHVLVNRLTDSSFPVPMAGAGEALRVEQGPPTALRDFEIDVGAMRGAAFHHLQPWSGIEAKLTMSKSMTGTYHIEGTIANRSGMDIRSCVLVLRSQPFKIDDLDNGETQTVSVDLAKPSSTSIDPIINALVGPTVLGSAGREQQRRRNVLDSVLRPQYYYSSPGSPSKTLELFGLTLLGWMDTPPNPIRIQGVSTTLNATTLLVASLPAEMADPNLVYIPKGTMAWQSTGGDPTVTPQGLYSYQSTATFVFYIPDVQNTSIDMLTLHIDSLNEYPYGNPPVVYIKNVRTDKWDAFTGLTWGENDLPQPQQFIGQDGGVEIRVSTQTIGAPASIDFTAQGTKK